MVAAATCGTTGRRIRGAARLMKKLGVIGKMRITSTRRFLRQYLSFCTSKASKLSAWTSLSSSIALLRQYLYSCTSKTRVCVVRGAARLMKKCGRHCVSICTLVPVKQGCVWCGARRG
jgi:aspartate/glutamate racemase